MKSYFCNSKVLIIIVMLFAVSGLSCKQKPSEQPGTNITQPDQTKIEPETKTETETGTNLIEPMAPEEPADSVAVTVNGVDITEEELQKALQPQLARMAQQNQKLPPGFKETLEKKLRQQMLDQLIIMRLLEEKAKEANFTFSEEEVINQIKNLLTIQGSSMTLEQFKEQTAASGKSFEDIKKRVERGLAYQKIVDAQWAGKINITEEDAKKYYDENPTQFKQVRASHILIDPKELPAGPDPNQQKAIAKAKAEDLLKQIKEGANFAALAKANSHCPSSAQGGDLGFFPRGKMAAPFEKAAFALETGKLSDIVETQFGYHIIKVTDRKDSFERFKDEIINKMAQKQQAELTNKYIDSLKAAASIVYPPGKETTSLTAPTTVTQPR